MKVKAPSAISLLAVFAFLVSLAGCKARKQESGVKDFFVEDAATKNQENFGYCAYFAIVISHRFINL